MSKAAVAVVLSLVLICLVLAYLLIDRSVSLAYSRQSAEATSIAMRELEFVLTREWKGLSEAEVLQRLQATFPPAPGIQVIVKKEDNVIWLDEIPFNFEKERLKSIGGR